MGIYAVSMSVEPGPDQKQGHPAATLSETCYQSKYCWLSPDGQPVAVHDVSGSNDACPRDRIAVSWDITNQSSLRTPTSARIPQAGKAKLG